MIVARKGTNTAVLLKQNKRKKKNFVNRRNLGSPACQNAVPRTMSNDAVNSTVAS